MPNTSYTGPMRKGDRVQARFFERKHQTGIIVTPPVRDVLAGRCCLVHWDDGSESLCCTADLRRDHSRDVIPISALTGGL